MPLERPKKLILSPASSSDICILGVMRGPKLLKEPSSSAICAFCSHRLQARLDARFAGIQQRLLHSNRSTPRSISQTSVPRNEGDTPITTIRSAGKSNGQAPAVKSGRIPIRSRASVTRMELPHERQARERMGLKNDRPSFTVGREVSSIATRNRIDGQRLRRDALTKIETTRLNTSERYPSSLTSQVPSNHTVLDGSEGYRFRIRRPSASNDRHWPNLRKRTAQPSESDFPPSIPSPAVSQYVLDRDRREEEAKKGVYTPIATRTGIGQIRFSFRSQDTMRTTRNDAEPDYERHSALPQGRYRSESAAKALTPRLPHQPSPLPKGPRGKIPIRLASVREDQSATPSGVARGGNSLRRLPTEELSRSRDQAQQPLYPSSLSQPVPGRDDRTPGGPSMTSSTSIRTATQPSTTKPVVHGEKFALQFDKALGDTSPSSGLSKNMIKETGFRDSAEDVKLFANPAPDSTRVISSSGVERADDPTTAKTTLYRPLGAGVNKPVSDLKSERKPRPVPESEPKSEPMSKSTSRQAPVEKQSKDRDEKEARKPRKGRFEGDEAEDDEGMCKKRKGRKLAQVVADDAKDGDSFDRAFAKAERRRLRKLEKMERKANAPTTILLPEYISVSNLASALKVRVEDFRDKLEELGFQNMNNDHILDAETSGLISMEYNYEPIVEKGESKDLRARPAADNISDLPSRPPVVTIMGHVNHGKTTILDYLRKSSVVASEHGGITQHIGAFSVPISSGRTITILDTPGHEAFLEMRQRGANVTDIVVLVVAADDSVKPQTVEAIRHAKVANVPMIVAINKIDKGGTDIQRVKSDLARHEVEIEDFGGETQVVEISAKTGQGIPDLEHAVLALAELIDMRAETDGPVEGWVLEASIKTTGKVATVLVRRGTMRHGDVIVAGKTWARVRCMRNEAGEDIEEAGPGTPVEIDGWRSQPEAGDEVLQASDEVKARDVVDFRLERAERDRLAVDMEAINNTRRAMHERKIREREELEARLEAKLKAKAKADEDAMLDAVESMSAQPLKEEDQKKGTQQLRYIIKADVSGSLEPVINSVSSLGNSEVETRIIRSGVGRISEFDVMHAAAAQGSLINFNTSVDTHIQRMADEAKVKILDHNIIYRLANAVKKQLEDLLPPAISYKVLGEADILQIFSITVKGRKQRPVAGCKIKNGIVAKRAKVRVLRGEKIFDGFLSSLKHVKKDIDSAKKGSECGMAFEKWDDFLEGDQVQAYEEISEKRYL